MTYLRSGINILKLYLLRVYEFVWHPKLMGFSAQLPNLEVYFKAKEGERNQMADQMGVFLAPGTMLPD